MKEDEFNQANTGYGRNYMPGGFKGRVQINMIGKKSAAESFTGKESFFVSYRANGKEYSWVQTIPEKEGPMKDRSRALSTIKGFLSALIGPEEFEASNHAEVYKLATSEANPFADTWIELVTKEKPNKPPKTGVYTVHDWTHVAAG